MIDPPDSGEVTFFCMELSESGADAKHLLISLIIYLDAGWSMCKVLAEHKVYQKPAEDRHAESQEQFRIHI